MLKKSQIYQGNRVRISKTSEWYSTKPERENPNLNGTIIEEYQGGNGYCIRVKWDNGAINVYRLNDLEASDEKFSQIFYYVGSHKPEGTYFDTEQEAKDFLIKQEDPSINWDCCVEDTYKQVEYFGKTLFIKKNRNYIATNSNGDVYAYHEEPLWNESGFWLSAFDSACDKICSVIDVTQPQKTLIRYE